MKRVYYVLFVIAFIVITIGLVGCAKEVHYQDRELMIEYPIVAEMENDKI